MQVSLLEIQCLRCGHDQMSWWQKSFKLKSHPFGSWHKLIRYHVWCDEFKKTCLDLGKKLPAGCFLMIHDEVAPPCWHLSGVGDEVTAEMLLKIRSKRAPRDHP